jgi:RNA polymerase sigma-70 factor, ECF subfamily
MAQEASIRAYVNLSTLEHPARFAAWLRRIVFGTCMDWLRAFRPELYRSMGGAGDVDQIDTLPDAHGAAPHQRIEERELSQVILRAIAELPPRYRIP